MVSLRTQLCQTENIKFSYDVNVDKEGNFTTTLPQYIVSQMMKVGIELNINRKKNYGFFSALSLKDLNCNVEEVAKKFSAKELIAEKVILKYSVETMCNYCKTNAGNIVPNGSWATDVDGDYHWTEGTKNNYSMSKDPFGFSCYVKAEKVKVWKFPDGEIKKEYFDLHDEDVKHDKTLFWLNSLCNMGLGSSIKEIDYTPEIGVFFKNMILYICNINEKIQAIFGKEFDLTKIDTNSIKQLRFLPN